MSSATVNVESTSSFAFGHCLPLVLRYQELFLETPVDSTHNIVQYFGKTFKHPNLYGAMCDTSVLLMLCRLE